jgi:hypothetical protein
MGLGVVLQQAIVDWLKGTSFIAAPVSMTLALSTADPLDDGSGLAEPTGNGYARQTFTPGARTSTNGVGTTVANATDIIHGPASGSGWGTITHFCVIDSSSRKVLSGSYAVPKNVAVGDSFVTNAGSIILTVR